MRTFAEYSPAEKEAALQQSASSFRSQLKTERALHRGAKMDLQYALCLLEMAVSGKPFKSKARQLLRAIPPSL